MRLVIRIQKKIIKKNQGKKALLSGLKGNLLTHISNYSKLAHPHQFLDQKIEVA